MSKRRKAHGRPQKSNSRKTAKRLAKKAETLAAVVAKRKPNKNHKIKSSAQVEKNKAASKNKKADPKAVKKIVKKVVKKAE